MLSLRKETSEKAEFGRFIATSFICPKCKREIVALPCPYCEGEETMIRIVVRFLGEQAEKKARRSYRELRDAIDKAIAKVETPFGRFLLNEYIVSVEIGG